MGEGEERERERETGSAGLQKMHLLHKPRKIYGIRETGSQSQKGTKDRMSSCFPCRSFCDRASQKFYVSYYTQSGKPLENFWEIFAIFFFKLQSQFCPFFALSYKKFLQHFGAKTQFVPTLLLIFLAQERTRRAFCTADIRALSPTFYVGEYPSLGNGEMSVWRVGLTSFVLPRYCVLAFFMENTKHYVMMT